MRICIVNQSSESDEYVQTVIRSINAQLVDIAYHWSVVAQCRLEGVRDKARFSMKELRGDALVYITDNDDDTAGWHEVDKYGVPYGVVSTTEDPWSVTLSHEVLELLLDPHVNRLAEGPHPIENRKVFHWYELCDAVQADTYTIGKIHVSDFVLPAYFTPGEEKGMRMSYLGADIKSFGIAEGGYVGFFDPKTKSHQTFSFDQQGKAAALKKMKNLYGRVFRHSSEKVSY